MAFSLCELFESTRSGKQVTAPGDEGWIQHIPTKQLPVEGLSTRGGVLDAGDQNLQPHPSRMMETGEPTGGGQGSRYCLRPVTLIPAFVEESSKMGGGVLAGAGGVLQHVHECALLGTIKVIPVLNEHGGNRGEGMLPATKRGVVLVVAGNPGGLEERVDGMTHVFSLAHQADTGTSFSNRPKRFQRS